ncbi:MAG: hypothetical protein V1752_06305, partial [Candidatus Firestonebacteria bacterium]
MYKKIAVVLLSIISVSLFYCEEKQTVETDQGKIKEYLETVNKCNANDIKTLCAILSQSKRGNKPTDSKYYQKKMEDGSTLTRIESTTLDNKQIITIQNRDGLYTIREGQAYKNVYLSKQKKDIAASMFKEIGKIDPADNIKSADDKTILSMEESEYDGIPCFIVTINSGVTKEDIKAQADYLLKFMP